MLSVLEDDEEEVVLDEELDDDDEDDEDVSIDVWTFLFSASNVANMSSSYDENISE